MAADDQQAKLEALNHVPMGARAVTLVGMPCRGLWPLPRNTHLGAMVIVRRHGFSNDQWVVEGANLLPLVGAHRLHIGERRLAAIGRVKVPASL